MIFCFTSQCDVGDFVWNLFVSDCFFAMLDTTSMTRGGILLDVC